MNTKLDSQQDAFKNSVDGDHVNKALLMAGGLNGIAALLHLACIFFGPSWYRFFGAGEHMARMSEKGLWEPTLITLFIFSVLVIWSLYALVGAGVKLALPFKLPFIRPILWTIFFVLLVRGIAGFLPALFSIEALNDRSTTFWIVSSMICLIFAMFHFLGLRQTKSV